MLVRCAFMAGDASLMSGSGQARFRSTERAALKPCVCPRSATCSLSQIQAFVARAERHFGRKTKIKTKKKNMRAIAKFVATDFFVGPSNTSTIFVATSR
jgi:hypothetical protein